MGATGISKHALRRCGGGVLGAMAGWRWFSLQKRIARVLLAVLERHPEAVEDATR